MTVRIPTREGDFTATYSELGLARLEFPGAKSARDSSGAEKLTARQQPWHALTKKALENVLAGRAPKALPPLDLGAGTDFQQLVWRAMLKIPPGRTLSYGEIAAEIGRPKAVRAVGGACGANPIPVLIPCHRVLAAGTRLGGFSAGLDWKVRLHAIEGIVTRP